MKNTLDEILHAANNEKLRETGGSHNQQGIDFQRYWAIARMIDMEESGAEDFLLLFEVFQDVAELDSVLNPSHIRLYQVKKKVDAKWKWNDLTCLTDPLGKKICDLEKIVESPIGKLYKSVQGFSMLQSEGYFVSNAGSDIPFDSSIRASNPHIYNLSNLKKPYRDLLINGLQKLGNIDHIPDPSKLYLQRVTIHPEDPKNAVVGKMQNFLLNRSPEHAGQAQSLVEALYAAIGPLGANAEVGLTIDDMYKHRGYSKNELEIALAKLQCIPDESDLLEAVIDSISKRNLPLRIQIEQAIAKIRISHLEGRADKQIDAIEKHCDEWLEKKKVTNPSQKLFNQACRDLGIIYPTLNYIDLMAHLVIRMVKRCVAPISEY